MNVSIKSFDEIVKMREAGRIVALAHEAVAKFIKPGVTTLAINDLVESIILKNGATPSFLGYGGFPAAVCASVNDVIVHGFPNDLILVDGDIVVIDIGAFKDGYHGDSA